MDPKIRIMTILLIEKIKADPEYAYNIDVTDSSHYKKDEERGDREDKADDVP